MTEHQREDDLLSQLLTAPPERSPVAGAARGLSPRAERALLGAANQVGTPTLAPSAAAPAGSFVGELAGLVRRYPLPAVALGAGMAFLLTRRHSRGAAASR